MKTQTERLWQTGKYLAQVDEILRVVIKIWVNGLQ